MTFGGDSGSMIGKLVMRIRRCEETKGTFIEVQLEDCPRDDESQEQFEERMVRLTSRLLVLDCIEEKVDKEDGLPECECHLTGYDPDLCPRHTTRSDLNRPTKKPDSKSAAKKEPTDDQT